MLQSFDDASDGAKGPQRLSALRARLAELDLQGWLVPRSDAHLNEHPPASEERLAWLTGFTGSAGLCAVLEQEAALFVDGRYTIQAPQQVDGGAFEIIQTPEGKLSDWLRARAHGRIGFDPWLHSKAEIEALEVAVAQRGATMVASAENPIDEIWSDRPAPPSTPVVPHLQILSGVASADKRADIATSLTQNGVDAAVLTRLDSIAWLFNLRGGDIARTPLALAFAILDADGRGALYSDPTKFDAATRAHLGNDVKIAEALAFGPALEGLAGRRVRLERNAAPIWVADRLTHAGAEIDWGDDPCSLPKARKNPAELGGARAAHLRDAAAMARFLRWLDQTAPKGGLTEIDAVEKLEATRREIPEFRDISFDTISGAGPNAALPHYRVTRASNRAIRQGEIYLVDSGAQYQDGTTDITRTVAVGMPPQETIRPFTLVLKGMIAVSRARFAAGTTGRDVDVLARAALWGAGLDYDHGTGHGVGAYLGVHEGPQSLSRRGVKAALEPGMIVSNEPGYYREGAFGIRIENLLIVTEPAIPAGGERAMLGFETLTLAPIDRRLIEPGLLTMEERDWLNAYHARVLREVGPLLDHDAAMWLKDSCAPL